VTAGRAGELIARTSGAKQTRDLAAEIAVLARPGDIVVLVGELGSGKTVWAQGFARGLGVTEPVTSPTFTLVRPYAGTRLQLLHVDVYRLDTLSEVVDLGIVEQLDGPVVACIEWGDLAEPALPADFVEVRLEFDGDAVAGKADLDDVRTISFRPVGRRWMSRREALAEALSPWLI
jgi:tRNA threonylcarbamoyladenosine biosynthesis protein TsaE